MNPGQLAFPLLDECRRARSIADARPMLGAAAEEVAAARLGAERLFTDSRLDYCPDLARGAKRYEVKSCGRNRNVIIYLSRLERDAVFARDVPLFYVVISHRLRWDEAANYADLRARLGETATMHVFPFSVVAAACARRPARILNPTFRPELGMCQRGYERGGWCLPLAALHREQGVAP